MPRLPAWPRNPNLPSPTTAPGSKNPKHPKQPARMRCLHVQRLEPPAPRALRAAVPASRAPTAAPGTVSPRGAGATCTGGRAAHSVPRTPPEPGHRHTTRCRNRNKPGARLFSCSRNVAITARPSHRPDGLRTGSRGWPCPWRGEEVPRGAPAPLACPQHTQQGRAPRPAGAGGAPCGSLPPGAALPKVSASCPAQEPSQPASRREK